MQLLYVIGIGVLAALCVLLAVRICHQRRYIRVSDRVNDRIFRNVAAYLLLVDPDFNVLRTNYYSATGAAPKAVPPKVGNLLRCKNGEDAGVCGTHELCADCPVRAAIAGVFRTEKGFSGLEAPMVLYTSDDRTTTVDCDVSVSGNFLTVAGQPRVVLTVSDITAQKRTQRELEEARTRAEESDRMKSLFLANTSHELRTPLNAIVGFSGILASTDEEQEKQEYMSIIESNNTLLLQLISDILDLSKIEAGTLEFVHTDFELNKLMREKENVMRLKTDQNVELVFEQRYETCHVRTDRNRLSQLMINLLTNAAKFTHRGSIRFGYELRAGQLYFWVADTGCGIPAERKDAVFERFVKLNSFKQGTGLGLSICRTIVEHLGGNIGVESEEGKGSTFWFTLPYVPGQSEQAEAPAQILQAIPTVEKDKLVILIAEDNESNYRLFESILRHEYKLVHAWNGREAVDLFNRYTPHLVLMDINMPVMDGYEATAEIRKQSADVPIIAVTAFAFASDEQKVLSSGFDGYMPKPINARQLKTQVLDMLRKRMTLI